MQNKILNRLIWLLVALLYSPVLYQLYRGRWETIDYTHAYFILPVSLWLTWRALKERKGVSAEDHKSTSVQVGKFGLPLVILGLAVFIFGWRWDYLSVATISAVPLLFGIVLYMYGAGTAAALSFPILYLLLMVPPPLGVLDSITIPMRYGISALTADILRFFHYPISREGLLLYIGKHEIYMGAPCSGFRSLITMVSLGLVYAYISKGGFVRKSILFSSIIPLAVIGNLVRVLGVCLVTFHFGEAIGAKFHDTSGFVIFLILILGMIGVDSVLERIYGK